MEGKETQKDILRLQKLEQAKHENGSTSFGNVEAQSSFNESKTIGNGYPIEAGVQNRNN